LNALEDRLDDHVFFRANRKHIINLHWIEKIEPYFNGGLFTEIHAIDLERNELEILDTAARENWGKIRPAIFGSIFEATSDSKERHARGMHFTSEVDIMKIVVPTITRYWEEKIEVFARASLSEDIRMISGVPAWMMIFFDALKRIAPNGKAGVASVYSNLEMVVHGGVNFSPYLDRFRDILAGSHAELREVYPASE
jgi:hypothetical protein